MHRSGLRGDTLHRLGGDRWGWFRGSRLSSALPLRICLLFCQLLLQSVEGEVELRAPIASTVGDSLQRSIMLKVSAVRRGARLHLDVQLASTSIKLWLDPEWPKSTRLPL